MGILRAGLVVACVLVVEEASASACKICLPDRTPDAVPENPSFVVERDSLDTLTRPVVAITEIDARFVWVRVAAHDGDVVRLPELYATCSHSKSFIVRKTWQASSQPMLTGATLGDYGMLFLALDNAWWTRLEWADSEADLDAGLAQTEMTRMGMSSYAVDLTGEPNVYLRFTSFDPDGSTRVWNGWVHLGPLGHASSIGTGPLPVVFWGPREHSAWLASQDAVATDDDDHRDVAAALLLLVFALGGYTRRNIDAHS